MASRLGGAAALCLGIMLAGCASEGPPVGEQQGALCTEGGCGTCRECIGGICRVLAGDPCGTATECRNFGTCSSTGSCLAGTPKTGAACTSDGNACTADKCTSSGTCGHTSITCPAPSNACQFATCNSTSGCGFANHASTVTCNDSDNCTVSDHCNGSGTCIGGGPLTCASDGNPCTTEACTSGACRSTNIPASANMACNDGSACTPVDTCNGSGACTGTGATCVADTNPCTTDTIPATCPSGNPPCDHAPLTGTACSDNDGCTLMYMCSAGTCMPGTTPKSCDDSNPCTVDSCVSPAGTCMNVAGNDDAACDDNVIFTENDKCAAGRCVGTRKDCDDNNACTIDTLNETTGVCDRVVLQNGQGCNDNNPCTVNDTCGAGGVCGGDTMSCDDNNAGTLDRCENGACLHDDPNAPDAGTEPATDGGAGTPDGGKTGGKGGGCTAAPGSSGSPLLVLALGLLGFVFFRRRK